MSCRRPIDGLTRVSNYGLLRRGQRKNDTAVTTHIVVGEGRRGNHLEAEYAVCVGGVMVICEDCVCT